MSETYIPIGLRREIRERAHNCCEYCRIGEDERSIEFAVDHIIAEKHGGQTISNNLCLSCYWCNSYKGSDISSVDWSVGEEIVPLFNPRREKWTDHFSLNGAFVQPLTPVGRVTVSLLRLNAAERIEERALLIMLEVYPCP
ncbi:MAG: HNH endonuclease [Aggregatilineales bacterium]